MEMEYGDYLRAKNRVQKIKNIIPQFIPSPEEVDELVRLTKEIRTEHAKSQIAHGRRYEYENNIRLIEPGKVGETFISEEAMIMYLILIMQTAKPRNETDRQNLEYIDKYIKQTLIIKGPKEDQQS